MKTVIITNWHLVRLEQQCKTSAYTLQSKHFTFCSCTLTFCSKHLIPCNLEGFYIFASKSKGNKEISTTCSFKYSPYNNFPVQLCFAGFQGIAAKLQEKNAKRFTGLGETSHDLFQTQTDENRDLNSPYFIPFCLGS